ncbi:integrase [Tamilnaduibacter salinus]|uniref:Integrase n=1 Tax=Tamilnaduibacter salinus TaxID=1484056 RepID=A0A2A2I4G0_9GAMM|nr:integrase arm-type DNA-binding domain-containing protein [Tamilnaduibacter salinus]PAV26547.1 integrase [Tamilnaduibacter salinus]
MPKLVPELTAIQVKRLTHGTVKKAGKGKKIGDPCPALHAVGGVSGLNLYCRPPAPSSTVGARSWILRTVVGSRRIDLGLGPYPEVSLAQAREKAGALKDRIRFEGHDPIAAKKAAKSKLLAEQAKQRTFADVAQQYFEKKCLEFSGKNPEKQRRRLEQHLEDYCLPELGNILMSDLEPRHVVQALNPIWIEKTSTAVRVRITIYNVCEMVRHDGILRNGLNPAHWRGNLENFLASPAAIHDEEHQPTVGYEGLPRFWTRLQERDAIPARALEFQILTVARPGEVRFAEWSEIDFKERVWTVPGWKLKGRRDKKKDHKVPLTDRAIEILKMMPRDNGAYIFPGYRGKETMSENALNLTVKEIHLADIKAGGDGFLDPETGKVATAHGMRAAFKDWATEVGNVEDYVSELALSHIDTSSTRAAYKRGQLIPKRRKLMKAFEKYLSSSSEKESKK